MARQTQIQTTYDPSLYNEGVILQVDGSVLTKPVNEDGTSDPSKQQTLTEPGKGKITINQTVNGSLSTYEFNVNQKEDQVITLPTIKTKTYYLNTDKFELGVGEIHYITLSRMAVGAPIFQMNIKDQPDVVVPKYIGKWGPQWEIWPYNGNNQYTLKVTYLVEG